MVPLHVAAKEGRIKAVGLLEAADVNVKDNNGVNTADSILLSCVSCLGNHIHHYMVLLFEITVCSAFNLVVSIMDKYHQERMMTIHKLLVRCTTS